MSTALQNLSVNHIGAQARLILALDGVRRLWRINYQPDKRPGIKPEVLLLSDGGKSIWSCSNSHLEETSLKETYVTTDEEKNYLLRVRNPQNPFCPEPMEEITFSKEKGAMVSSVIETPRTAFHYIKRSNRTVTNSMKKQNFEDEKIHTEASNLIKTVLPQTMVRPDHSRRSIAHHMLANLSVLASGYELSEEEGKMLLEAMDILSNGKAESGDEDLPI